MEQDDGLLIMISCDKGGFCRSCDLFFNRLSENSFLVYSVKQKIARLAKNLLIYYINQKAHLFHGPIKYNYFAHSLWLSVDDETMHNGPIKTNY